MKIVQLNALLALAVLLLFGCKPVNFAESGEYWRSVDVIGFGKTVTLDLFPDNLRQVRYPHESEAIVCIGDGNSRAPNKPPLSSRQRDRFCCAGCW